VKCNTKNAIVPVIVIITSLTVVLKLFVTHPNTTTVSVIRSAILFLGNIILAAFVTPVIFAWAVANVKTSVYRCLCNTA
jgi:hypothetical protein